MRTGLTNEQIAAVREAMRESGQSADDAPPGLVKPHEETWTTGEGVLSGALYSGDTWIGSFTDPKRARLAVQAPRLVERLLIAARACKGCDGSGMVSVRAPHGYDTCSCPTCEDDWTVLRAAGVI